MKIPRFAPFTRLIFVYVIISILCTQFPLVNYLGYEFSAIFGIVSVVAAGLYTISLASRQISFDEKNSPRSLRNFFYTIIMRICLVSGVPILVMAVNSFFVRNCDFMTGVMFFILIPVVSSVWAVSFALFLEVTVRHPRIIFIFCVFIILLHPVYLFYNDVSLFSYNILYGFIPGVYYDEGVSISVVLLYHRLLTVLSAYLFLILTQIIVQYSILTNSFWRKIWKLKFIYSDVRKVLVVSILLAIFGISYFYRNEIGFESSYHYVQKELGGKYSTKHFDIYYSPQLFSEKEIKQVAGEHEFYLMDIFSRLHTMPDERIQSYIFSSSAQKRILLGTGVAAVTKPMKREMFFSADSWEQALHHELVHVVSANFGMPVLRISPRFALIEGLAVAFADNDEERTSHQYAAGMIEFGIPFDMNQLLSVTGFFSHSPNVGYTLAGSFVRFLIDRYGVDRMKELYRTGSFEHAYYRSEESIIQEWEEYIQTINISDGDESHMRLMFHRKPLHRIVCARTAAELMTKAMRFFNDKRYDLALEKFGEAYKQTESEDALIRIAQTYFRMQQYDSVAALVAPLVREKKESLPPALMLIYADALCFKGDCLNAKFIYSEVFGHHFSRYYDEAASIRLTWLLYDPEAFFMRKYYQAEDDSSRKNIIENMLNSSTTMPKDFLFYLLMRLNTAENHSSTLWNQIQNTPCSLPFPTLNYSFHMIAAELLFTHGEYQHAMYHYWNALNYTDQIAEKNHIEKRIELCEWFTRHSE